MTVFRALVAREQMIFLWLVAGSSLGMITLFRGFS
jgi:hypothetical protein